MGTIESISRFIQSVRVSFVECLGVQYGGVINARLNGRIAGRFLAFLVKWVSVAAIFWVVMSFAPKAIEWVSK